MSDHLFGLGKGWLGIRAEKIAKKYGAELVNHTDPDGKRRHWFRCPNYGAPFDQETARAVLADLGAERIAAATKREERAYNLTGLTAREVKILRQSLDEGLEHEIWNGYPGAPTEHEILALWTRVVKLLDPDIDAKVAALKSAGIFERI